MTENLTLDKQSAPRINRYRLRTVALTVAATEAAYLVLRYGAGIDLTAGDVTVGPAAVAVTAAVAALAGWALLAVLERFTSRAVRIWRIVAVAVFLVSLLGTLGGVDAGAVFGLSLLHAVVAGALITGLPCRCR
ncbi:DUF6069 family protein [Actinoplanes sp. NBC_00393]|uniref:DUF6069 family protein n=1 Tax=Actinoplanes sp. NBC_00393 TaxID=2975953 RepID=UPI002E1CB380